MLWSPLKYHADQPDVRRKVRRIALEHRYEFREGMSLGRSSPASERARDSAT